MLIGTTIGCCRIYLRSMAAWLARAVRVFINDILLSAQSIVIASIFMRLS